MYFFLTHLKSSPTSTAEEPQLWETQAQRMGFEGCINEVQHEQFLRAGLELTAPFLESSSVCLRRNVLLLGCSCGSTCLLYLAMRSTRMVDLSIYIMPTVGPWKYCFPRFNTTLGCTKSMRVAHCLSASMLTYMVDKRDLWEVSGCFPFCEHKIHCLDKACAPKKDVLSSLGAI